MRLMCRLQPFLYDSCCLIDLPLNATIPLFDATLPPQRLRCISLPGSLGQRECYKCWLPVNSRIKVGRKEECQLGRPQALLRSGEGSAPAPRAGDCTSHVLPACLLAALCAVSHLDNLASDLQKGKGAVREARAHGQVSLCAAQRRAAPPRCTGAWVAQKPRNQLIAQKSRDQLRGWQTGRGWGRGSHSCAPLPAARRSLDRGRCGLHAAPCWPQPAAGGAITTGRHIRASVRGHAAQQQPAGADTAAAGGQAWRPASTPC